MATLNVLCGICSEFYTNRDTIYVTKCGHVFHQNCLFHWLKCSHTCPQCRDGCMRHQCHKVFLNFEPLPDDYLAHSPNTSNIMTGHDWINIDGAMDEELLKTFAFHLGTNEDNEDIYAARAFFKGDLVPGNYCPRKGGVILPWGFKSHLVTRDFEVLDISCDNAEYKWIAGSGGSLPENALVTGHSVREEPLYTARVKHEERFLYGKVHLIYNSAYVPYRDEEVCSGQYEVLVRIPKPKEGVETSK